MKHSVLLIFFGFILISQVNSQIQLQIPAVTEQSVDLKNYTGPVSETYPNGKPRFWKNVILGKTNGLVLEWYPDGVLKYKGEWKNGMGYGLWEYYYPNGQLKDEGSYLNDVPTGLFITYHDNGAIESKTNYVDGQKSGEVITYSPSGILETSTMYVNGKEAITKPTLFQPGIIATAQNNEWDISFTPNGDTLYFTRKEAGAPSHYIFKSVNTNGYWSKATRAFPNESASAAHITADGLRMYHTSVDPLPGKERLNNIDCNIWYKNKTPNGWSESIPLGPEINKVMAKSDSWPINYEDGPYTDIKGNLYFWTMSPNGKSISIYKADKKDNTSFFTPKQVKIPPYDDGYDVHGSFSPDGNFFIFSRGDAHDSFGGEDLYVTKWNGSSWSDAQNLGPFVNSPKNEGGVVFSPDGKYIYFNSNRANTRDEDGELISSIYFMETAYLMVK